MNRSTQTWRRLLVALVLATGVAVVWGLAAGWIASLAETILRSDQVHEDLSIALDGTPVISTGKRIGYNSETVDRRTLDGKPWPTEYENWLGGGYLPGLHKPPGLFWTPLPWGTYGDARIGSMDDGKRPPTAWYLVRDDEPTGHMYLVGFDPMSKLSVGFLGKSGFRVSPTFSDEQFAFPNAGRRGVSNLAATTQYIETGRLRLNFYMSDNDARPAAWLVYVLDGEQLMEVDLRQRTTRPILQVPGVMSMSLLRTTQAAVGLSSTGAATGDATNRAAPPAADAGPTSAKTTSASTAITGSYTPAEGMGRPPMTSLIAFRTDKSIVVHDPLTDRKWTFQLPADEHPDRLSAYFLSPSELVVQFNSGYWSGGPVDQLLWLKNDGTVTRRERVELLGWVPPPSLQRKAAWGFSAFAPVPIAWFIGVVAGYPINLLQDNNVDRYVDALGRSWEVTWPPFVVVLAVSAAAAWIVRVWQHKYRRPNTGLWSAFIFLFGVPGLAAYWLEQSRPKLETCRECGHVVPRDRDTCADCRTPFAAPALVRTEIFA